MHRQQRTPAMSPEEAAAAQRMMLQTIDRASDSLVNFGVNVVRRNPIKTGFWIFGLLLGFLANGFEVTPTAMKQYSQALDKIPYPELEAAHMRYMDSRRMYEHSRGWFWTCNTQRCQDNKAVMEADQRNFAQLRHTEAELMKDARQSVGLFSTSGVAETRQLFWNKFDDGKNYASRKTKWDILFAGISAIGRDEKIGSFLFRIACNFLINITLGLFGAVISFWWNLWSLIQSYRAGILSGLFYFGAAGLAAGSFAMLWLVGIYSAAAGTVFVAAKVLASNVRIEDADRTSRFLPEQEQRHRD